MDTPDARPRFPLLLVGAIVAVKLALHFLWNDTYGLFRDEYYYIACSERLAWGYVDHPPLSIALLAAVRALLGESAFALRLVPVLAGGATVIVTALLARELGGRRFAQAFAALLALAAPILLVNGTFYSMNALELLLWPAVALVLLRLARGGDRRLWLVLGALLGLAALNKLGTGLFAVALAVGVGVTPLRRALRGPWPWAGALLAAVVVAPHLLWQLENGWPFLEFVANARAHKMADTGPGALLIGLLVLFHPVAAPVWLGGLGALLAAPALRAGRALGVAFVVLVGLVAVTGGKTYYAAPAFPLVAAAGAVALERLADRLAPRRAGRWLRPAAAALIAAGGAALAPLAVPILPPEQYVRYAAVIGIEGPRDERTPLGALPQHFADRFGWEELVDGVARVWQALPPEEREGAAIFAGNYGEAGAIDRLGPALGLPPAISGHNAYWHWGPRGASGAVLVTVGVPRERLDAVCTSVEERGRVVSRWGLPSESDLPVHVCRGLRLPMAELWQRARRFI